MLACNGFTREVLSLLDSHLVALSLQVFHRHLFQNLPNNISLAHIIDCDTSLANTQSLDADAIPGHAFESESSAVTNVPIGGDSETTLVHPLSDSDKCQRIPRTLPRRSSSTSSSQS